MRKRIYFHAVWPFIYTKTEVLSRKTIISKNSGQSGDFWRLCFCVCVCIRSNGILGSHTSQYATKNASRHVSILCVQFVCLLIMDAVKVVLIYTLMQTLWPVCIGRKTLRKKSSSLSRCWQRLPAIAMYWDICGLWWPRDKRTDLFSYTCAFVVMCVHLFPVMFPHLFPIVCPHMFSIVCLVFCDCHFC